MNKKLLVAAVAAALAAPGIALAQVTITGKVGAMFQSAKYSGATAGRAGNNTSTGISDNTSTLTFRVREDLGGGLAAYGQFEFRQVVDSGAAAGTGGSGSPPQWIGLESKTWGNLRVGTLTGLHFVTGPDAAAYRGTAFNSVGSIQSGNAAGGFGSILGMFTRLRNAVAWDSPNWGGFKATVAYSSSGSAGADGDLFSASRKGRTWNFIPQYITPNWNVGYSHYDNKPDAPGAATVDERGNRLYGEYKFGAWSLGAAWDRYKTKLSIGTGADVSRRDAYSLHGGWDAGPHSVGVSYARANKDKVLLGTGGVVGANTGATSIGAAYQYSLSKRTKAFVSWYRLTNQAAAAYGPAGLPTPAYSLSPVGFITLAGEDVTQLYIGMNHSF